MQKPNILIVMTDQQRGRSIAPYHEAITPNIDKFCQEGVTFTKAYTVAPHCCPSRASFFTGLYPSEHGVWNNVDVGNTLSKGLYDGVRFFSEDLQDAGYRTAYCGKWHVSAVESPLDRGFQHVGNPKQYSMVPDTHTVPHQEEWGWYTSEPARHKNSGVQKTDPSQPCRQAGQLYREGYPLYTHYGVSDNPHNDNTTMQEALQLIQEQTSQPDPWCTFVGPLGPHDPYTPPQKFLDLYSIEDITLPANFYDSMQDKPGLYRKTQDRFAPFSEVEHKEAMRHYLAFCSYEDYLFSQLLEALDESGQADNTLVLFLSDHGDYMAEHGLWCKGLPCFAGAYHIPAVIRWPQGVVEAGRVVDDLISMTDFAPTLLEVAGIQVGRSMSGHSLKGYLLNNQQEPLHTALYTQTNGNELYGIQRSVFTKKWKYVYNGFDYDELYNLQEDPHELCNLASQLAYRNIIRELAKKMWQFAREHKDVCINPYIMVSLATYGPGIINEDE